MCYLHIHVLLHLPFYNEKFFGHDLKKFGTLAVILTYIRPELLELIEWQRLGGFVTQCWQKILKKLYK